jgi:hypothetical protein
MTTRSATMVVNKRLIATSKQSLPQANVQHNITR